MSTEVGYDMRRQSQPHFLHLFHENMGVRERVKVLNKGKPMFSDEMLKIFPKVLQLH